MRSTTLATALLVALAGCSNELLILQPVDAATPGEVADADAATSTSDAWVSPPARDAQVVPLDSGVTRDATTTVGSDAGPARTGPHLLSAFSQTCMVESGDLTCWGDDSSKQVGIQGDAPQPRPVELSDQLFLDVCAGERHSCALRSDGTVLCWGANVRGELGVGDFQPREQPTEVTARRFSAIACGGLNTCAIAQRGELFCWGENKEGKLGQGDPARELPGTTPDMPTPVSVAPDRLFSQVSVGQGHVCAISEGSLFCWGRNTEGQLGVQDTTVQRRALTPVAPGTSFARVAAGQRHTCAIDSNGRLLCWGENRDSLLGLQTDVPIVRLPTMVGEDSDHTDVKANWFHSCTLKKSGTLVCWGRNAEGQLGLGDAEPRAMPTRVGPEFRWRSFAVGQFHSCAIDAEGTWCWGVNGVGQLGNGDFTRRDLPTRVLAP